MSADKALDKFGELLDMFFPAGSGGPSWSQIPYDGDLEVAVLEVKRSGVSYDQLTLYVRSSWDIARKVRLGTSERNSLDELLLQAKRIMDRRTG